jgi:hypothetical protein
MNIIAKYALENPNAIKNMCKDMRKLIKKNVSKTLIKVAFKARKNLETYVQQNFKNPNGLITKEALFVTYPAFGHTENLGDIQASVGFSDRVDFMKRQDEGGWHRPKYPAERLMILTDAAKSAGLPTIHIGKRGKQTIRGKVRHTIRIKQLGNGSHKAVRVARAAIAFKTGLLMFFGANRNLFRVTDFTAIDGDVKFKMKLFVNREYEKTYTPAKRFFKPECEKAAVNIQEIFNKNMDKSMGI